MEMSSRDFQPANGQAAANAENVLDQGDLQASATRAALYVVPAVATDLPVQTAAVEMEMGYAYVDKPVYEAVKRVFDVVLASVGLVLASPIMLVTAIRIKIEDGGSIFYGHKRVGRNGKPFTMYKFRSMKLNADRLEDVLTPEQLAEYKKNFKIDNDPRITRVGKFIRSSSIDELPQFVNVLNGTMSMVGPRPVLQEETELYGEYRDLLLSARPGLTGYWQAYARSSVSYENFARQRMELYYVANRSIWMDVKVLWKTVGAVIHKVGAK